MGTTDRLDSEQYLEYRKWGIRLQEEMFGKAFANAGGESLTSRICKKFKKCGMSPGQKVLDLGCGSGGSAFFLAKHYGVDVHGVDISSTMIAVANEYRNDPTVCSADIQHRVQFENIDLDDINYRDHYFDVIFW